MIAHVSTILVCGLLVVRGLFGCCWDHACEFVAPAQDKSSAAHADHHHEHAGAPAEDHQHEHHTPCQHRWCDLTNAAQMPPRIAVSDATLADLAPAPPAATAAAVTATAQVHASGCPPAAGLGAWNPVRQL